ncbi:MAG: membrane protein [Lysobacterales bacterium]|nr:MAG: membrane protein [Xanthomonadales bacterium]
MNGRDQGPLAVLALLAGASLIGLAPIFVRLSEVGPVATAFWRVALAAPMLLFLAHALLGRPVAATRGVLSLLLAVGLFFAGDLALWHQSIRLTSVANATLLANLAPVLVALSAWLLFGERPGLRLVLGLLLALAGAVLLLWESATLAPSSLIGDLFGVGTAFFYAAYLLGISRLRRRLDTASIMAWTSLVTAIALLPLALAAEEALWPRSLRGWLVLFSLALFSHALGQGLIAWAMAALPASFSALALLWQPVAAALLAVPILGEPLRAGTLAGGTLVLAAIALAYRPQGEGRGAGSV